MKTFISILAITVGLLTGAPVSATTPENTLALCLVDNLDGKERRNLAKWISFAISAHPEIKPYSSATPEDIRETDEYIGALVTRLLTSDCPTELKDAARYDPMAINNAFELVGRVAMQELMNNQDVVNGLTNYSNYTDNQKIMEILSEE